jgi:hypothetical protein
MREVGVEDTFTSTQNRNFALERQLIQPYE